MHICASPFSPRKKGQINELSAQHRSLLNIVFFNSVKKIPSVVKRCRELMCHSEMSCSFKLISAVLFGGRLAEEKEDYESNPRETFPCMGSEKYQSTDTSTSGG